MVPITLTELVERVQRSRQNAPRAVHSARADYLGIILSDEEYYTERVDDVLTVHRSLATRKLVGCTLKGVSQLMKRINTLSINDSEFELRVLLLGLPTDVEAPSYRELASHDFRVPRRLLEESLQCTE